jgi:signal transduction histidine kinase/CheY-like chemotaxis protein
MHDGMYRWFAAKGVPIVEEDGSVREWIGTATDIDQRRSSEEHLHFLSRASELFASSLDYESTLRNLTQAAVPALADWCTVDIVTEQKERPYERIAIAHVDPDKVDLAWDLYRKYPPDPDIDVIARTIRSATSQLVRDVSDQLLRDVTYDDEHYRIAKELGLVSWMVVPLPGRRGPLGAITFVSSDSRRLFTALDLKHAEEFARRAAAAIENAMLFREVQAANRSKDDFLATLSHELRTPLTAILGWSRVLQESEVDQRTFAGAVDAIVRSAQTQAVLVDDVLDMSRIISGKMRIRPEPVNLVDVVEAAMKTVEPAANARGVALEFQHRPGTTIVTGDPDRLQQIVWNLLSNAIKFTPRSGEVVLRLEQSGSFVRLTVRDSGKGIPRDFLPHVFEPFRQAESVTTRTHGGLGLGLAISKQLVELHGGTISASSEGEGSGATFVIELPVCAVAKDKPMARSVPRPVPQVETDHDEDAYPSLDGVRVLFVDDQEDARTLVKAILDRCAAQTTTAASVADAVDALQLEVPDVIISDIAMPGADGFDFIRHVRDVRKLTTPAIAMTAFTNPADRERMMAAGFDAYLKKPVDPVDLARQVHAALLRRSGAAGRPEPA